MPHPLNDTPVDALARIERSPLTWLHVLIIGFCACGFAIDFVEVALGNALSAIFSAPPHVLPAGQLSWLLSAVFIGAIAGAPVAGWIADRQGPRSTLSWTMLWLAATTLMAGLSPSPGRLTAARLLSGIALGAYPPLMMAYLTDILPARRRGAAIFAVCAIAYLAPPVAIFTLRALTPMQPLGLDGWRWLFLGAAGLCALAGGLSVFAPEAPHWLAARGAADAVSRVAGRFARSPLILATSRQSGAGARSGLEPSFAAPPDARSAARQVLAPRFVLLCLIYFLIPWATQAFPLITAPILLARHFDLADTLFYVGLAAAGPAIGTVLGGAVVDRVGRPTVMVACALGMLLSAIAFLEGQGLLATATALIVFGVGTALYMPAMTLYAAEMYGPAVRSRTSTIAWAFNRAGAAVSPVVLLPFVHAGRLPIVAVILGVILMANIAAVLLVRRLGRGAQA